MRLQELDGEDAVYVAGRRRHVIDVKPDAAALPTAPVATWTHKDLLDTDMLTRDDVRLILETAEAMREIRSRPVNKVATLRGVTVVTLFYEQSTRTRASFEVAAKALGADVVNLTASGIIGGQRRIAHRYRPDARSDGCRPGGDAAFALGRALPGCAPHGGRCHQRGRRDPRPPDAGAARPVHHPAAPWRRCRETVVIVGDIRHSRVARSNLWLLLSSGARVTLCAPATLLPRTFAGVDGCTLTTDFDQAVDGADVVMALRMQKERQEDALVPLRQYVAGYQLNARRLALARPGALVMHPGPMNEGVEISPEVAHSVASVIEEQVTNGVSVRMAVLYLMATARRG